MTRSPALSTHGCTTPNEFAVRMHSEITRWHAVVENEQACDCGGKDGIVLAVCHMPLAPTVHNHILLTAFSHAFDATCPSYLTIEEAKQLANRLGEAIAAAEAQAAQ